MKRWLGFKFMYIYGSTYYNWCTNDFTFESNKHHNILCTSSKLKVNAFLIRTRRVLVDFYKLRKKKPPLIYKFIKVKKIKIDHYFKNNYIRLYYYNQVGGLIVLHV